MSKNTIDELLNKIESGLPEIKIRSISSIYSKIKARLLKMDEITSEYFHLPGHLLAWINSTRNDLHKPCLEKAVFIIEELSKTKEGSDILSRFGAVEFLVKFNSFIKDKNLSLVSESNERIITNIVGWKADELSYKPVDEDFQRQRKVQENDEKYGEEARKHAKRPQPAIEENINTRAELDQRTTKGSYEILRNEKNKSEMIWSPVLNAEIFKTLERREFLFLPNYELTEMDQKVLFDLGVQIKFGKRSNLLECLLKELPKYLKELPLECVFIKHDIIENILIFGNTSDSEMRRGVLPSYRTILVKMQKKIVELKDQKLRPASTSKPTILYLKGTDKVHLGASYPSLNPEDYTQENYEIVKQQAGLKMYSFTPLLDGIIKNVIGFCTENSLICEFGELFLNHIIPLLKELKPFGGEIIRNMINGYIATIGSFIEHSPLNNLTSIEHVLITIIFDVAMKLINIYTLEEWRKEEILRLSVFFTQMNMGVYLYMFSLDDTKFLMKLLTKGERDEPLLYKYSSKIALSVDSIRTFEANLGTFINVRDKKSIDYYKQMHNKLEEIFPALEFTIYPELADRYVESHLKSVLIRYKCASYIDEKDNLYDKSKYLVIKLSYIQSNEIKQNLLKSLLERINSQVTMSIERTAEQVKFVVYEMLRDTELRTRLLINSITSEDHTTRDLGYELLLAYFKRIYAETKDSGKYIIDFIPYLIKHESVSTKAKYLLSELKTLDPRLSLHLTLTQLFSLSPQTRQLAYSSLWLSPLPSSTSSISRGCMAFPGESKELGGQISGLLDPLCSVSSSPSLQSPFFFSSSSGCCSQTASPSDIDSLYSLLSLSFSASSTPHIQEASLRQLSDAVVLFRGQAKVRDVLCCAAMRCWEALREIGSPRPLNALLHTSVATEAARVVACFLEGAAYAGEVKEKIMRDVFEEKGGEEFIRGVCKLVMHSDEKTRNQGLYLLNILLLAGERMKKSLQLNPTEPHKSQPKLFIDSHLSDSFIILFDGNPISFTPFTEKQAKIELLKSKCFALDGYIQGYLEEWQELSKQSNGDVKILKKYKGQILSRRKERILKEGYSSIQEKLSERILYGRASDVNLSILCDWISYARLSILSEAHYFFNPECYEIYQKIMTDSLITSPNIEQFEKVSLLLISILKSRSFKQSFMYSEDLRCFARSIIGYLETNLVPFFSELQVGQVRERISVVNRFMEILACSTHLAFKADDHKLITLIRNKIFCQIFVDKFLKIMRVVESSSAFTDSSLRFVRLTLEIMESHPLRSKFYEIVSFIFDSLMIVESSENFLGTARLNQLLKLAFALISKGRYLPKINEVTRSEDLSSILKSTTVGWIVRLLESRSAELRIRAWNTVVKFQDANMIEMFPSLTDQAMMLVKEPCEFVGVKSLGFTFLSKLCSLLRNQEVIQTIEYGDPILNKRKFIDAVMEKNILTQIKAFLDNETSYQILQTSCIRFMVGFSLLDPASIFPILNSAKIGETLLRHMEIPDELRTCNESLTALMNDSFYLEGRVHQIFKISSIVSFLCYCVDYIAGFASFFLKCTPVIERSLLWMNLCSLYEGKHNISNPSDTQSRKILVQGYRAGIRELSANFVALLSKFVEAAPLELSVQLNKCYETVEEHPLQMNIFSTMTRIAGLWRTDRILSKNSVKIMSKILLVWEKGFKIIDQTNDPDLPIIIVTLAFDLFKGFDYRALNEESYLEVIDAEEFLYILGVLISKSCRIKYEFIRSGALSLFINKFNQILHYFGAKINLSSTQNSFACSQKDSKKSTLVYTSKEKVDKKSYLKHQAEKPVTMINRPSSRGSAALSGGSIGDNLKENIRCIIENSSAHFTSYLQVMKSLFFNPSFQAGKDDEAYKLKFRSCSKDLIEIIEKIWSLGRLEEEFTDNILDILTNWQLNDDFNTILFSKLIENKFYILNEILNTVTRLDTESQNFSKYLSFIRCLLNRQEMRNQVYKTRFIQTIVDHFLAAWRDNRMFTPENSLLKAIISFLHPLSFFEESHLKILCERDLVDALAEYATLRMNIESKEELLSLISNLVFTKSAKSMFHSCTALIDTMFKELSDHRSTLKIRCLSSQFFVNLLHKNTRAIPLLDKSAILDDLVILKEETETRIDLISLGETQEYFSECERQLELNLQATLANNLRIILSIVNLKIAA